MQGRLRNEELTVEVESECVHCRRALHLTFDSELDWRVAERGARPLLFEPDVDWQTFTAPNIIHDY